MYAVMSGKRVASPENALIVRVKALILRWKRWLVRLLLAAKVRNK